MVRMVGARGFLHSILESTRGVKKARGATDRVGKARKVIFTFDGWAKPLGPYLVPVSVLPHLSRDVSLLSQICGASIRMRRSFHTGHPINR